MRILHITPNVYSLFPTSRCLAHLFSSISTKYIPYGPGHVESTKAPIAAYVRNRLVDIIIVSPFIYFYALQLPSGAAPINQLLSSLYRHIPYGVFPGDLSGYCYDLISQLHSLPRSTRPPIIVPLVEGDLYRLTSQEADLISQADYLLGPGCQFTPRLHEMNGVQDEAFGSSINDNLWELFASKDIATFSFLDFASPDSLIPPFVRPKFIWSVLGVKYALRRQACQQLKLNGIAFVQQRNIFARALTSRAWLPTPLREAGYSYYFSSYLASLRESSLSFTCGSLMNCPVTKMFEIPASGNVLVSPLFHGAEDAGFVHNHNCIAAYPSALPEVHERLSASPESLVRISVNGFNFIRESHSMSARARQIKHTLHAILAGTAGSSSWKSGKLQFLD